MEADTKHALDPEEKPATTPALVTEIKTTARQAIWRHKRAFLTGLLASFGALYIGYTDAAVGTMVANRGFIEQFGTVHTAKGIAIDAKYISVWNGVQKGVSIVTHLLVPYIVDRFGRKLAMFILLGTMTLAIVMQITARNWQTYTAAEVFVGISTGFLGVSYTTYMSEVSMTAYRGVILCSFQLSFKMGSFMNAVAAQIVNEATPMEYRRVFYSEFVFVAILLAVSLYLPESPIWLIRKGKPEKARRSLNRIFGQPEGFDVDHYLAFLTSQVQASEQLAEADGRHDWRLLLFKKSNFLRCLTAALPYTGQQVAGVAYINSYTNYFFQQAGVDKPFLGNVILTLIALVGTFGSFFIVDKVGRRPLLLGGMGACIAVNFLIGGLGFLKTGTASSRGAALVAICAVWEVCYGISVGPLGWSTLVEVSSLRLAAKTATFGLLSNDALGLIWKYCVPLMLSAQYAGWAQKVGLLFGGLAILWWIGLFFLFPETKGRTFAEIDELYERGVAPRRFAQTQLEQREGVPMG